VYPGARHVFEVSELPAKMRYRFGTIGYDPQAGAAAWEEVQGFPRPLDERKDSCAGPSERNSGVLPTRYARG
jgi:hypothetical protein